MELRNFENFSESAIDNFVTKISGIILFKPNNLSKEKTEEVSEKKFKILSISFVNSQKKTNIS